MNQALILVDIQNDYFTGGNMQLVGMEDAADNAGAVLSLFRKRNIPIFHIQHISIRPGATFFLPGTEGADIHKRVEPWENEPVIRKNYPNCFRNTSLLEQLHERQVEQLVFCGAMSHMCIDTTVRAAFDLGFQNRVVHDACATRDLEFNDLSIAAAKVHAAFMAALAVPFASMASAVQLAEILS